MPLTHFILALLVTMVWGFNFVVIKVGLHDLSPLLLAFIRFFLTSIPVIFFIKRPKVPFKLILGYGLFMFSLQFALLFIGMKVGVSPGLASLLLQLQVFFTILLAAILLQEKLSFWQIIGASIAFTGIGLVLTHIHGQASLLGFLLVIAAAASWGIGNIISKKIGKVQMVGLVVWGSLIAWPPLLVLSFVMEGTDKLFYALQHLTWLSGSAVLYITYVSTLFGFGMWGWLLHRLPLKTIAPFTLLVPVFGIISSVLVLGETLELWKIVAALLVMAGLAINLLGPRLFARK